MHTFTPYTWHCSVHATASDGEPERSASLLNVVSSIEQHVHKSTHTSPELSSHKCSPFCSSRFRPCSLPQHKLSGSTPDQHSVLAPHHPSSCPACNFLSSISYIALQPRLSPLPASAVSTSGSILDPIPLLRHMAAASNAIRDVACNPYPINREVSHSSSFENHAMSPSPSYSAAPRAPLPPHHSSSFAYSLHWGVPTRTYPYRPPPIQFHFLQPDFQQRKRLPRHISLVTPLHHRNHLTTAQYPRKCAFDEM